MVAVGPPYEAGLNAFVNGEYIDGRGVVVWYGAHFTHDQADDDANHVVGPDLKPYNW